MTTIRPALAATARRILAAQTKSLFEERPDELAVLIDPRKTSGLCGVWGAEYARTWLDTIVGATPAGGVLAFETARQLGCSAALADDVSSIAPGESVVVLGVVHRTGRSMRAAIAAVEAAGGVIIGCHVLVDRSTDERSTIASPTSGRVYPLRSHWRPGPE